ncbi:uncharacterized protein EURHEDRAFT_49217 [Aspergillus ruber CBS 135680]|uniref:Uncharacterized protein n=1 Tax=Aspergillus ruber (strain CBS 135680) TaxID=1388766 RepID=A0A017SF79_ASPRC|nr:uncharacterized protein EURHEDRAFT_49217 [Aspergillus ruber CBS 135680]EYE95663.1 hypothetical protein EURHEDRAFT_49217 [Aspergillus ruber CBS 135680]
MRTSRPNRVFHSVRHHHDVERFHLGAVAGEVAVIYRIEDVVFLALTYYSVLVSALYQRMLWIVQSGQQRIASLRNNLIMQLSSVYCVCLYKYSFIQI